MAKNKAKKKCSDWKVLTVIFFTVLLLVALAGCREPTAEPPDNPIIEVESTVALYISMEEDPSEPQTSLTVMGMDELCDTTLANIPATLTQGIGDKSDREKNTYFAFSFYLLNNSDCDISYEMTVNINRSSGNLINAIRVMVIEGDKALSEGDIYAKAETTAEGVARLEQNTNYTTSPFVSDSVACKKTANGFRQGTKVKLTLLVWIEGWDIDCTNEILANSLQMSVSVTAEEEK